MEWPYDMKIRLIFICIILFHQLKDCPTPNDWLTLKNKNKEERGKKS